MNIDRCDKCGHISGSVLLTTSECAALIGCNTMEFPAIVRKYLPVMHQMQLTKREFRWRRTDVECLIRVMELTQWSEQARRERPRAIIPQKLPADFRLPERLVPVRDLLTMDCDGPCIYFLFLDSIVQYVGKTIEPKRRIGQHASGSEKTAPKEFDAYLFYPVPIEEILQEERTFVALLDPPLNRKLKNKV